MTFSLILVLTIISMIQVNNYISCAKNETNEKRILEHNTNNENYITTTAEVLNDNSPEFITDKGLYYLKYGSKYLRNKP